MFPTFANQTNKALKTYGNDSQIITMFVTIANNKYHLGVSINGIFKSVNCINKEQTLFFGTFSYPYILLFEFYFNTQDFCSKEFKLFSNRKQIAIYVCVGRFSYRLLVCVCVCMSSCNGKSTRYPWC